ncbi:SGNH/GDSL hydrolase family protein [Microbacterium sp. BWT-B31]|uniref:SGNH/GDSL hydrolase family protein n=1 Tax=Microbacterium sp. BWT-B31 TaxID=3232072 RepID=UPI00352924C4
MTSSERSRPRPRLWPVLALGVAVVLICALAAWRPWAATPRVVADAAGEAAPAAIAPAPLALRDHPRVLVFGDSWVYGSAASVPTLGFAYVIAHERGWDATVDGVRGSGYLKPGIDGPSYPERIAALEAALEPDLVIIEGSINDRRQPAAGYRDAVTSAWDALAALYPGAAFVVLGPAPQVLPVEKATARIDRDLAELAAARGWWYISPLREAWITEANYLSVIDTSPLGNDHPSTAGHAYLAERLGEALDAISGTVATADGTSPSDFDRP